MAEGLAVLHLRGVDKGTQCGRPSAWLFGYALALLVLLPGAAWPHAGRRVALVVGNAEYPDSQLANPGNDAQDMSAKLRGLGFEVTLLANRNRGDLTTAVIDFGRRAAGGDAALFYFAGHGVQAKGVNYLLPVGRRFTEEADVEGDAVEVGFVLGRLEAAGAKVSLLILDACRSNPLRRAGRAAQRGLARMDAPSGALIAFAAQPGAEAEDGRGRNGTYTKHLLQHIGTPGLAVEEMFKLVRAGVEQETHRTQSPREETSLTTAFYFAGAPPSAPQTPATHPRPSSVRDALAVYKYNFGWFGGPQFGFSYSPLTMVTFAEDGRAVVHCARPGTIVATLERNTLRGTWRDGDGEGDLELTFNEDFTRADGWWRYKHQVQRRTCKTSAPRMNASDSG